MRTYGFLTAYKFNIYCLGEVQKAGDISLYDNRLNKFPRDTIAEISSDSSRIFDGYVTVKPQQDYLSVQDIDTMIGILPELRGGFCGYMYQESSESIQDNGGDLLVFTDQISNKTIYYYIDDESGAWIVSSNVRMMIDVMRNNNIGITFNENAARYMLTYGYMLDDCTYIDGIRRLLPGYYLRKTSEGRRLERYYVIPNEIKPCTMSEAVEKLDVAFREAIRREFEKDLEYGYRHLVDLSGGLDSRMVAWVAHDMGYTNQLNTCYCKAGYMDETISRAIAKKLNHEYKFMALDTLEWMYDIDPIVEANNGSSLYNGITGGVRMLQSLNTSELGIEHTGMVGDSIIGTFYHDAESNYAKPQMGLNRYSDYLDIELDDSAIDDYPTQEMFALYTRGILSAQTSFMMRQQFVETGSVFEDVDFMEVMYSIPFELRVNHKLYLEWIRKCYPGATRFGWEKWSGEKPLRSHIPLRMARTAQRLTIRGIRQALGKPIDDTMNPIDYWFEHAPEVQKYYDEYYNDLIGAEVLPKELREPMQDMYMHGNLDDKAMVLTVLAMIKSMR